VSSQPTGARQRLIVLFFAAFLVSVYAWVSASRIPWATGEIRFLVLELIPPGTEPSEGILQLNDQAPSAEASLDTAAKWLAKEYASYLPSHSPLDIEFVVSGPHAVAVEPPDVEDPDLGRWELLKRGLAYYWYFRDLSAELGADFGDYDARVVLILEPGTGSDAESRSMADGKQRFGVVHLDPEIADPNYALITVLHELGHTLGASDKYDPDTFRATWPEGFAEPHRAPALPQRFGEIMAVDVPTSLTGEREPSALHELRVGARTAAEFGWIPKGTADGHYESLPATPSAG
jgi:hypothetical protein